MITSESVAQKVLSKNLGSFTGLAHDAAYNLHPAHSLD